MDKTIPKINAQKKPSTLNPGTIIFTKSINIAFIINVKRPKVKILIGRVRIRRIGFKNAFIIPKTSAATNAVVKSAICTPGSIYAMLKTTIALTIQLISIAITYKIISIF